MKKAPIFVNLLYFDGFNEISYFSLYMRHVKNTHIVFIAIFSIITLLQAFFWLFANHATPIIMGMPFAMFFIVSLIIIEFVALLFLYYLDEVKSKRKEKN